MEKQIMKELDFALLVVAKFWLISRINMNHKHVENHF